ncbi:DNA mismatch repair protein MutS [Aureisphaera galaxeae]|uniref:MutS-related protein n=1 Tax=Aureisphaera galaxeae TaxID=1538023 RepID=UPI00234FEB0C|nr:DNA mismatch repair protein MutS [Aureisphaera galaxeae]MDC8002880.1 DNA mismatch repair protein MutS [Aureisphaera galaxeae]
MKSKRELREFYQAEHQKNQEAADALKKKVLYSSALRFSVFLLVVFLCYVNWGQPETILISLLVGAIAFIWLIRRHDGLKKKRAYRKAIVEINKRELSILEGNFHTQPEGNEYKNPEHFYSQDIDLFGRGSFYQYLNRTALESGSKRLAGILTANECSEIPTKQEAIKELKDIPQWRQQFSALASLVKVEVKAERVVRWLDEYEGFVPKRFKVLSVFFSVISLVLIALFFTSNISGTIVTVWFFLGLGIIGMFLKKINKLVSDTSQIQTTFEQFYQLLEKIEGQEFSSELLKTKKESIINNTERASSILKRFSKLLDALDQRSNMIVGIFANGFLLRDLWVARNIEQWIREHHEEVGKWFEVISFFDAHNSLGNYAFNHPKHTFPTIEEDKEVLHSEKACHPLIREEVAVANDFKIDKEQFYIITGANMAGKSTFLRTVALQIVMANVGLPICAESSRYTPIKLITSMRTTDSLTKDESYFFSELKRLKYIVDHIQTNRYFIILDEILKGTNSTDKAIGSRKFVDKLVRSHSTGIIATHDLSLCEAADSLEQVENYYFDAVIKDDELFFDYMLRKGICQNMNASFLLRNMGIVDD